MVRHGEARQVRARYGKAWCPSSFSPELGLFAVYWRMMVPRNPWLPVPMPYQVMPAAARRRS